MIEKNVRNPQIGGRMGANSRQKVLRKRMHVLHMTRKFEVCRVIECQKMTEVFFGENDFLQVLKDRMDPCH